jgi:uncharacterized membrane protein YvbJ
VVYCSRCGTQNPDDAQVCSNCGAPLYKVGQQYPGSDREHYHRMERECFGLPNGGLIVGVVIGIIVILLGIGLFLQTSGYIINFGSYLWAIILVVIGILILLGGVFGRRHRYRY